MTLAEGIVRFLQNQTLANFLEVRRQISLSGDFHPYANYEELAVPLLQQEKYGESIDALRAFLPGGFLSFSLHSLLAFAYQKVANPEEAQRERFFAQSVMNGLLQTGDGSEAKPYLVMQISDEYDVLRYLGKESSRQTLVQTPEKVLDQHLCPDGASIWFDITLPFSAKASAQMQAPHLQLQP